MTKVGVIGVTGYTGQELVGVLSNNPLVELSCITSRTEAGKKFSELYPKFGKKVPLVCENMDIKAISDKCDIVFLSLPHTVSMDIVPQFLENGKKVIDLSADYRLPADVYEKWYDKSHTDAGNIGKAVYGLPELNRDKIREADLIANPGCYPTSVILGLLPVGKIVAGAGVSVIVDAKSGITGAGRKAAIPFSFGEVDENFKSYKANEHQHIPEMESMLSTAVSGDIKVHFTPHLLPVKRGIFSTIYVQGNDLPQKGEIRSVYEKFYKDEPFVRVRALGDMPELGDVVGTNFCDIGIKSARGILIIVSVIDNLLKGAGGQAVQNMNIMLGLDERAGL